MPVRVQHEISPPPPNGKINQPGKCKNFEGQQCTHKIIARLKENFLRKKSKTFQNNFFCC